MQKNEIKRSCICGSCYFVERYNIMAADYSKIESCNPGIDLGLGSGISTQFAENGNDDALIDLRSYSVIDHFIARNKIEGDETGAGIFFAEIIFEKAKNVFESFSQVFMHLTEGEQKVRVEREGRNSLHLRCKHWMSIMWVTILIATQFTPSFAQVGGGIVVPSLIDTRLDSLYPAASNVEWEQAPGKRFIADFLYEGRSVSALFDRRGHLLGLSEEVALESLPEEAKRYLTISYGSFKLILIILVKWKATMIYEVQVIKGRHHLIVSFNRNGGFINLYRVKKEDYYP